jgi:tetratricopeptide (TPR) repeat protein
LARQTYDELGDRLNAAGLDNNLAILCEANGKLDAAKALYQSAVDTMVKFGSPRVGNPLMRLGVIAERAGERTTALTYFKRASEAFDEGGNSVGRAEVEFSLGNMHERNKQWTEADDAYLRGENALAFTEGVMVKWQLHARRFGAFQK